MKGCDIQNYANCVRQIAHSGKRKESSLQAQVFSENFQRGVEVRSCLDAWVGCRKMRERKAGTPSGQQNDQGTDQKKT